MLFNQLIALPRPETVDYLSRMLSGSPLTIDLTTIYVEINLSQEEMEPDDEAVYTARPGNGGVWYDTGTGISSWLIPLVSEQLQRRHFDLQQSAPNPFYKGYIPHMILVPGVPPLKRNYRTFMASINNTLATSNQPLLFDAEITRQLDLTRAPMYDFYQDKGLASASFM
jgi:hypothetical protein